MNPNEKSRDALCREADLVRSKLLGTVEQLDQRRHDALNLRLQLQRHLRQIAAVGGVGILATAGLVALVVHRISTAPARHRRDRWWLLSTLMSDPKRALQSQRRPFYLEALHSIGLSIITFSAMVPARRMITQVLKSSADPSVASSPANVAD